MSGTIIAAIKETTTLLKLLQLGEQRANDAGSFFSRVRNEEEFARYFMTEADGSYHIPEVSISADEISCALKLVYGAGQSYLREGKYTSLRLLADVDDRYGALKMDDYFVTPSYVDRERYQLREGLLEEEIYDPKQLSRQRGKGQMIPQDYVSSSLFGDARRVIVTGNPGVGKSTFARWLCHRWAKGEMRLSGVPLYVDLGQLRDEAGNGLVAYLQRSYLPGVSVEVALQVLKLLAVDFLFILDGFDEMDVLGQRRLRQDLEAISLESRYVLLSRPYGLIDNPGFVADYGLRIDGFTTANIEAYVGSFLEANGRGQERGDLMTILEGNAVLRDYAHTPLLLSFITYLYLANGEQFERLRSIYSRYELQHRVFEWLLAHEGQKNRVLAQDDVLAVGRATAYALELDQKLWVDFKMKTDPRRAAAVALSEMGLGCLRSLDRRGNRFSFTTLTFQEYLAANYLERRINAAGIVMLSRHKFFWNFTAMLFGGLGFQGQLALIEEVLNGFLKGYREYDSVMDWALYLLHLSETPPEVIEAHSRGSLIYNYLNAYQVCFHMPYWQAAVVDAMGSIYAKSGPLTRRRIEAWLFDAIKELFEVEETKRVPIVEFAKVLIVHLRLYEKEDLVAKYISLPEQIVAEGVYSLERSQEAANEAFEGISFIFEELLGARTVIRSQRLGERLRVLVSDPGMKDLFATVRYRVLARLYTAEEALKYLEGGLLQLDSIFRQEETDTDDLTSLLKRCAGGIYLCGCLEGEDDLRKERCELLQTGVAAVLDGLRQLDNGNDFDTGEIGTLAIEGVVRFNDPMFYSALYAFSSLTEVQMLHLRIPNGKLFFEYFGKTIGGVVAEDGLDKLVAIISLVDDVRHQFGRIRRQVGEAVVGFIEKHYGSFTGYMSHEGWEIKAEEGVDIGPLHQMNHFLHQILLDPKLAAVDRQYLVDILSRFREVSFFKKYLLPITWGDAFFQFFREEDWACLAAYHTSEGTTSLLNVLSNPAIYVFRGNLVKLKSELRYLAGRPGAELDTDNKHALFKVCGYTLRMLRQTYREYPEVSDQLVRMIDNLMQDHQLWTVYFDKEVLRHQDGHSILLGPFLYSFTGNTGSRQSLDFEQMFYDKQEGYVYDKFLEGFIDGFVVDGRLNGPEFRQGLGALDEITVGRVMEKLALKSHLTEPFSRIGFEEVLGDLK